MVCFQASVFCRRQRNLADVDRLSCKYPVALFAFLLHKEWLRTDPANRSPNQQ